MEKGCRREVDEENGWNCAGVKEPEEANILGVSDSLLTRRILCLLFYLFGALSTCIVSIIILELYKTN